MVMLPPTAPWLSLPTRTPRTGGVTLQAMPGHAPLCRYLKEARLATTYHYWDSLELHRPQSLSGPDDYAPWAALAFFDHHDYMHKAARNLRHIESLGLKVIERDQIGLPAL